MVRRVGDCVQCTDLRRTVVLHANPRFSTARKEIAFTGKLTTVEETSPPGTSRCGPPCGTVFGTATVPVYARFEVVRSSANFSTTDHSIGPGLEVAMAFRSVRPIRISVFAQVRALWLVSGTTTSFTDPNGVRELPRERDDLVVRGGAGVRLSWVGFD